MVKRCKYGKKAISAGDGEYPDPDKPKKNPVEQRERLYLQMKKAKKKYNDKFKVMDKNDPELVKKKAKEAKRKKDKRAELKASTSSKKPLSRSAAE